MDVNGPSQDGDLVEQTRASLTELTAKTYLTNHRNPEQPLLVSLE